MNSEIINVTRTHLPDRKKFDAYIDRLYETAWVTNNGEFVQELTARLEEYLGVENLLLVSNGTMALQVAYKTLGITGRAITTPFSFVATTSSLVWSGIEPVFADINPKTFCIDPVNIEKAITPKTTAIVPVHVFGNACEVEAIDAIAKEHDLKVIYDGAHAFGVNYKGESLLKHGDATILSFHATKLFHTIEGGAIVFKRKEDYEKAKLLINFGLKDSESIVSEGINAKMNEFQAAMGLCVLDEIDTIIEHRAEVWDHYVSSLKDVVEFQERNPHINNNYIYFPVLFKTEDELLKVKEELIKNNIFPRRYFYPSLDTLDYLQPQKAQVISRDIASRILCLPIYSCLKLECINTIIEKLIII